MTAHSLSRDPVNIFVAIRPVYETGFQDSPAVRSAQDLAVTTEERGQSHQPIVFETDENDISRLDASAPVGGLCLTGKSQRLRPAEWCKSRT